MWQEMKTAVPFISQCRVLADDSTSRRHPFRKPARDRVGIRLSRPIAQALRLKQEFGQHPIGIPLAAVDLLCQSVAPTVRALTNRHPDAPDTGPHFVHGARLSHFPAFSASVRRLRLAEVRQLVLQKTALLDAGLNALEHHAQVLHPKGWR